MKNMTFGRYLYVLLISAFIANTFDLSHAYAMKRGADEEDVHAEEPLRTVKRKRTYEVHNPLYDTLFKKVFQNPLCLVDLLNGVFNLEGEGRISSVEYLSGELLSEVTEGGTLIFDIHCKTGTGDTFIVEMQKGMIQGMTNRLELYSAAALKRQWDLYSAAVRGQGQKLTSYRKYGGLQPVRTLAFLDYSSPVFRNNPDHLVHRYQIRHIDTGKNDLSLQQWTLVDLIGIRTLLAEEEQIPDVSASALPWFRFLTRVDNEKVEIEGDDNDPLVIAYRAVSELTEAEQKRVEAEEKAATDLRAHFDAGIEVASNMGALQGYLNLFDKGRLSEENFLEETKGISVTEARQRVIEAQELLKGRKKFPQQDQDKE